MTTRLLLEELSTKFKAVWFNVHQPDTVPDGFLQPNLNPKVPMLMTGLRNSCNCSGQL